MRIAGYFLAAAVAWAADSSPGLEMRIVEGDGSNYSIGTRATRGLTVLVSDGSGRPVEGATVSFSLPASGPGGVFASGSRTELVTTHADGRAAVWGMQWNRTTGPFEIRIAAVKGETRGTVVSLQNLIPADRAAAASARIQRSSGGGHKLLWISLAAAGAVVAGVAGARLSNSNSSAPGASTSTATTSIGAPTIILGHP